MTIHKNTWFKAGLTLSAAGLFLMTNDAEASASQKWVPRTVLEIENDINNAKETMNHNEEPFEYTVKWGDTLWGVSQATDISVDKLAKVNEIDNPNLIIAGSTVYVTDDLSVVSVQNDEVVTSYDVSSDDVQETETPENVEQAKESKKDGLKAAEQEAKEEAAADQKAAEEAAAQAAAEQEAKEKAAAQAATEQEAEEEAAAQAAAEQKAEEEAAAQAVAEQEAKEKAAAQAAAEQEAEEEAAAQAAAEQNAEEEAAAQAAAEQNAEEEAAAQAAADQNAEEEAAAQAAAEQEAEEEAAAQDAVEQAAEEEAAAQAAVEQAAEEEAAAQAATEEESGQWMSVEATAYSRNQTSLSNFTFLGIDLRDNSKVIAVDPDVIPLESKIYIPGYGEYIAGDTGGAINGSRIDLHMESVSDALDFGRQQLEIKILD